MSRRRARFALAGAVALLVLLGGAGIACSSARSAPPSGVTTLAPFSPGDVLGDAAADAAEAVTAAERPVELQVRGPSGERVMITLQTGHGASAEHVFRNVTLPYFAELSDTVTGTSVGYLGPPPRDVRSSAAMIECTTMRGTTVIEQDSAGLGLGEGIVFCGTER